MNKQFLSAPQTAVAVIAVPAQQVYEVTAAGFIGDGSHDDRVIWVSAASRDDVVAAVQDTGGTVCDVVYGVAVDDDSVDFELPRQAIALGETLLHFAGDERNRSRAC